MSYYELLSTNQNSITNVVKSFLGDFYFWIYSMHALITKIELVNETTVLSIAIVNDDNE